MEKYDLIIHIGQGKTGTSSVQYSLSRNKKILEKFGYKDLKLNLSNGQLYDENIDYLNKQDLKKIKSSKLYQLLRFECNVNTEHTLIWSNEQIFETVDTIPVIEELAKEFSVLIIVYIRRPDKWAKSAYVQWGIKHKLYNGIVQPFNQWIDEFKIKERFFCLENWQNAFSDDIVVKNFDAVDDVVEDFMNILSVREYEAVNTNETPLPEIIYSWVVFNSMQDEIRHPAFFETVGRRLNIFGDNVSALLKTKMDDYFPTGEQIKQVLDENIDTIDFLNDVLEKNGESPFSLDSDVKKHKLYSQDNINKLLLFMVFHLERRVHKLEHEKKHSIKSEKK